MFVLVGESSVALWRCTYRLNLIDFSSVYPSLWLAIMVNGLGIEEEDCLSEA